MSRRITRSARKALREDDPEKKFTELKDPVLVNREKKKTTLGKFKTLLVRYPFLMNGAQAATLTLLGTLTKQLVYSGEFVPIDILKFTLIATFLMTPISVVWYGRLHKKKFTSVANLLLEWTILTPLLTGIFWVAKSLFESQTIPATMEEWNGCRDLLVQSYAFWVPWSIVRLIACPVPMYVLFNSIGTFVWTIIQAILLDLEK
mmetsp:Transcript_18916/g.30080  ORF Transcript_18916/g.30080 Transcript_18916/m.30080 type:complete len:204 (+) Transcript_18916:77-688(+)